VDPQTFAEVIKQNGLKSEDVKKHTVPYDELPESLRKYNLKPLVLDTNVDYGSDGEALWPKYSTKIMGLIIKSSLYSFNNKQYGTICLRSYCNTGLSTNLQSNR
jgi:hypothetical protein